MDCVRCGVKLEADARFCRNCGLPTAATKFQHAPATDQEEQGSENTVRIGPIVEKLSTLPANFQLPPETPFHPQGVPATPQQGMPQQNYPISPNGNGQHIVPLTDATVPLFPPSTPASQNFLEAREATRRAQLSAVHQSHKRNTLGPVLGCLGTLLVLTLVLAGVWAFVLRPYVHDLAVSQMDSAMTSTVNQIPPVEVPIPPGTSIPIAESTLNTALANNATNPIMVNNANIQITANQVLLDFQVYGQECTITSVPKVQNGKLVATDVTISGIAHFILSPDDVTRLLNSHLEDAQKRINHRITNVHLLDQEIDITVS